MIYIKNVPNIISVSRILGCIVLLLVKPLSLLFIVFYILCGVSDILDGYIARKNNSCSQVGSILDSIADTVFVFILLSIFIPLIDWSSWMLGWILVIALIRFLSLVIGYVRYHSIAFLHTYANKITGIMLFCFPIFYGILDLSVIVCLICSVASLSAIEEMLINMKSKELSRDVKSIFVK